MNLLAKDKDFNTAVVYACEKGDVDICQFLLFSIRERHEEKEVTNILQYQTRQKKTPLYFACKKGSELVKLLLRYGDAGVTIGDEEGVTPLASAAKQGKFEIVKLLAEASDILKADDLGNTAFSNAAQFGHKEIMEHLFEVLERKGSSEDISSLVNQKTDDGMSPLLFAAKHNRFEEVTVCIFVRYPYFSRCNHFCKLTVFNRGKKHRFVGRK